MMLYRFKRHRLPVQAHFEFVLSLTYAMPISALSKVITPGLQLDEWNGLGFLAAAFVQTRDLRLAFLPRFMGARYFFGGYRVFCRYTTNDGREIRGLRILRSDTDKRIMVGSGNFLAHYNYRLANIDLARSEDSLQLRIASGDGNGDVDLSANITYKGEFLPGGSPFPTPQEARRFAGPTPFTFAYESETNSIIRIQGIHKNWRPRLIPISVKKLTFLDQQDFASAEPILASGFYMEGINYYWRAGVCEKIIPAANRVRAFGTNTATVEADL